MGTLRLSVLGAAQGERSVVSFFSTFQNTPDNGPRRRSDIIAGFNGGAWGNEYLSFNIGYNGSANDGSLPTLEKVRIMANGNVGIGTMSPDQKLTVNGTIHAKEVKIDLSVPAPDYVFEKNYKLKSLAEVAKYININKHLSEIPSAKMMEQNGVNVSELNMKLLQKVEELTLYLINMQKEIDNLKKRNPATSIINEHMKKIITCLLICCFVCNVKAQLNPSGYIFDEGRFALISQTSIVADAMAYGGDALYRPATASGGTIWYGPYIHLQGGSYILQVRLKVTANVSNSLLFGIDMVSSAGAVRYGGLNITPDMFRASNAWQLFSIPVELPDNVNDFELRGTSFQSGITDIYMDYINLIPGDLRGIYANEFTITGRGNVGIGMINPQEKLAVNGTIHSKEVKVDLTGWSDYVFKPTYKLPKLSEVKAFIDQNQHLPEMPSATEVEKDGVNLGEMVKLQTKKIEELTLYLIEKDKEKKEQDVKIDQLKQLIEALSKEIRKNQ